MLFMSRISIFNSAGCWENRCYVCSVVCGSNYIIFNGGMDVHQLSINQSSPLMERNGKTNTNRISMSGFISDLNSI